jgi:flagellar hook-basal body complex protein FliE
MAINPISSSITKPAFLNNVNNTNNTTNANSTTANKANEKPAEGKTTFGEMLGKSLDEIDTQMASTSDSIEKLVSGQDVDIHEFILETEKTAATVNLTMQVRNKVVSAYEEIMRMQL